jgi:hypothetical protein
MMNPRLLLFVSLFAGALQAQNLTTSAIQRYFNPIRRNLEASADVMPAEKYGFKLTEAQMTFGEWLLHSAERNYLDCSSLKGENPPETAQSLTRFKSKPEISKVMKDSFAYCAAVLEKMDDQAAISTPQTAAAFLHVLVHNNEIYGNIVGYMRVSGIVPPSTAGRGGGQNKK